MNKSIGEIVQIIGPVVDVEFKEGDLPAINDALNLKNKDEIIVFEVAKHIGSNKIRAISMQSTDGLRRGMRVEATGGPISVPVGPESLGRMFNVLGEPIDGKEAPKMLKDTQFIEMLQSLRNSQLNKKFWKLE